MDRHSTDSDRLLALVEIPKGSRNKYEYDEASEHVILDRFLSSSTVYPVDYGFLIGHRGEDGDPLDCLVCVPVRDPGWSEVADLEDLPAQLLLEVEHFFSVYKDLEHKEVETDGWRPLAEAEAIIEQARVREVELKARGGPGV
ncbi:MAG: inorganic diphosphatase [Solirubrobacterales bacterium]|nr:inorganic diphosphatase [Solirubrobacterales bacterium]